MAAPHICYEQASSIVVEAELFGNESAAKRHGISRDTVERYRKRIAHDEQLRTLADEKRKLAKAAVAEEFVRFLRRAVNKLDELIEQAKPDQIREVAGAIKVVGELQTVREAIAGQNIGVLDTTRH